MADQFSEWDKLNQLFESHLHVESAFSTYKRRRQKAERRAAAAKAARTRARNAATRNRGTSGK